MLIQCGQSSLLGALAAAPALLLRLTGGPDGVGQSHSADGAAGHFSAGHLPLDRWRKLRHMSR